MELSGRSGQLQGEAGAGAAATTTEAVETKMMEPSLRALIEAIHTSSTQAVLYIAGGASQVHHNFVPHAPL